MWEGPVWQNVPWPTLLTETSTTQEVRPVPRKGEGAGFVCLGWAHRIMGRCRHCCSLKLLFSKAAVITGLTLSAELSAVHFDFSVVFFGGFFSPSRVTL